MMPPPATTVKLAWKRGGGGAGEVRQVSAAPRSKISSQAQSPALRPANTTPARDAM